jgi:hypothetical protein
MGVPAGGSVDAGDGPRRAIPIARATATAAAAMPMTGLVDIEADTNAYRAARHPWPCYHRPRNTMHSVDMIKTMKIKRASQKRVPPKAAVSIQV